jgi:hypothetical protein
MTENKQQDPVDRLVEAYESMLERVQAFFADEDRKINLVEALAEAREKAVGLGELTREEADKLSLYVQRDIQDAAEYIAETGQEFRDWFLFDWKLIEDRLFKVVAGVADQTSLQLKALAQQAREASLYHTGEITGPGTLACMDCGKEIHFRKTGRIPPCPACSGTSFSRKKAVEE